MPDILDTYQNLAPIKSKLAEISCKNRVDQSLTSGLALVAQFLQTYSGNKVAANQQLFRALEDYDCETAKIKHNYADEARESIKDYLIHCTHHLWLERSGITPWSIRTYSASEIDALFRVNRMAEADGQDDYELLQGRNNYPIPGLQPQLYDSETYVHYLEMEAFQKLFPLARQFLGSQQDNVIEAVLKWVMRNFFHAENEWGWDHYADGRPSSGGLPPYEPLSIERLFEERIVGCHHASLLFSNILRLLNIPAIDIKEYAAQYSAVHSVTYLPTLQRFVHGDHIANIGAIVPLDRILIPLHDFIGIATYDENDPVYGYTNYVDGYHLSQMGIYKLHLKRNGNALSLQGGYYLPCDDQERLVNAFTAAAPDYAPLSIVDNNSQDMVCAPGLYFNLKSREVPIQSLAQLSAKSFMPQLNQRLLESLASLLRKLLPQKQLPQKQGPFWRGRTNTRR